MSDIIHVLPDSIANQIAAGEVIQRPASVVKELVENAVDAGATEVRVIIKDGGRTLIQVIDNGKGMSETDARMAFERHATSKIQNSQDLFALKTFGFRGEALASIVAIAHVELCTRTKEDELGVHLFIEGSELKSIEPEACAQGSVFSVKNLFYNVPARRKFLKTNETEFKNILWEFERIVLVNPDVSFFLTHNGNEIFNLPAAGLRQRVVNVFGKTMNKKMLSLSLDTPIVKIEGFVGRPDTAKKRGALQYFFVNGRYMRHSYFHRAVMQAYEQLIAPNEYPDYFLYFTVDPQCIDVNIHPTKTEIKFENEHPIWQIILSAVREVLGKANMMPTIEFDQEDAIDIPAYDPTRQTASSGPPPVSLNKDYNPFNTRPQRVTQDWEKLYEGFQCGKNETDFTDVLPPQSVDTPTFMPEEKADAVLFESEHQPCFQYKTKYILTSISSGLVLIDQHRAHVRILFDQYKRSMSHGKLPSQKMLFPDIVELTLVESTVYPTVEEELQNMGFDLSNLGGNSYAVNGIPAGTEHYNPAILIKEILGEVIEMGDLSVKDLTDTLCLSLAKASAIPSGKVLSNEEMEHMFASLFSLPENNFTPDGQPILTLLTDDELAKRFRRN